MGAVERRNNDLLSWTNEVLRKDPNQVENVIRAIGYTSFGVIAALGKSTPLLHNMTGRMILPADYISCVQGFTLLNYWHSGEWRGDLEKDRLYFFGQATFTSVTGLCIGLLLDDLKFIEISKYVASIGQKFAFLRPLTELSTTFVLRSQIALGFAFFDIRKIIQFNKSDNTKWQTFDPTGRLKRQYWLDIAQMTSSVALNVLFCVGYTTATPALIAFGIAAYSLGCVSFIHKYNFKKEIDVAEKAKDKAEKAKDAAEKAKDAAEKAKDEAEKTLDAAEKEPDSASASADKSDAPLDSIGDSFYKDLNYVYAKVVDLGDKIANKFEGFDASSKLGIGILETFKFFSSISKPCSNLRDMLDTVVQFNKVAKLVDYADRLRSKTWTFADTAGLICSTVSSIFDAFSFYWCMSDLGKPTTVFKLWKNGFLFTGLFTETVKTSREIKDTKVVLTGASNKLEKWKARQLKVSSVETLHAYYNARLAEKEGQSYNKVQKWEKMLLSTDYASFNSKVEKKMTFWDSAIKHCNDEIEEKEGKFKSSVTKMFSITLDFAKTTLDICAIAAVTIPGIGIQIAVLYYTRASFVITNLVLGVIGMKNFYSKEYARDAFKKEINEKGVKLKDIEDKAELIKLESKLKSLSKKKI